MGTDSGHQEVSRFYLAVHINNMRKREEAVLRPQYSPRLLYLPRPIGPRSVSNSQGVYCGLSTASEVFLILITQLYNFLVLFFY